MNVLKWFKAKISGPDFLLFVTIVLFVLMYIAGLIVYSAQGFGKMQTFMNMLIDNAALIIASAGMTVVIITGGIDISVGSVVGLVCMMLAFMMEKNGNECLDLHSPCPHLRSCFRICSGLAHRLSEDTALYRHPGGDVFLPRSDSHDLC